MDMALTVFPVRVSPRCDFFAWLHGVSLPRALIHLIEGETCPPSSAGRGQKKTAGPLGQAVRAVSSPR